MFHSGKHFKCFKGKVGHFVVRFMMVMKNVSYHAQRNKVSYAYQKKGYNNLYLLIICDIQNWFGIYCMENKNIKTGR